jgi:hypothetical protein
MWKPRFRILPRALPRRCGVIKEVPVDPRAVIYPSAWKSLSSAAVSILAGNKLCPKRNYTGGEPQGTHPASQTVSFIFGNRNFAKVYFLSVALRPVASAALAIPDLATLIFSA